jgi:protein-S-isoprenylcysteine O-methyltransferase Ste14
MSSAVRSALSTVFGIIAFVVLLFVPAGTLHYWQAWVFLAVFVVVTLIPSVRLNRIDPAAVERRRRAGPTAETRPVQKVVMTAITTSFAAVLVVAGLDRRFGWSNVPVGVSLLGDVMVAAGLGATMLVIFQNRYAAATITVEKGQPLASTGLYRSVRHPMYSASVVMMVGMPLALGSFWALLPVLVGVVLLVVRILDEERLLRDELAGYREYMDDVRSRLVPHIW